MFLVSYNYLKINEQVTNLKIILFKLSTYVVWLTTTDDNSDVFFLNISASDKLQTVLFTLLIQTTSEKFIKLFLIL